jgi:hypothetical protein
MRSLMLGFCLSALVAAGCHDNEVCNPGLELVDGVCIPGLPVVDAGWSSTDAATDVTPVDAGQD